MKNETALAEIGKTMKGMEKLIEAEMLKELNNDEIYTKYLSKIKGIGVVMSSYLISWLCRERDVIMWKTNTKKDDIPAYGKIIEEDKEKYRVLMPPVCEVADRVSKLYTYAGLLPNSKREKGKTINYNPKVKTLMWKTMRQILMAKKSYYARLYDLEKAKFQRKYKAVEKGSLKLKIHYTAIKVVSRKFVFNLWLSYRFMRKLPATYPYVAKLGHDIEPPFIDGVDGKPEFLTFLFDYIKKFSIK
jgi:hypothetical protein